MRDGDDVLEGKRALSLKAGREPVAVAVERESGVRGRLRRGRGEGDVDQAKGRCSDSLEAPSSILRLFSSPDARATTQITPSSSSDSS